MATEHPRREKNGWSMRGATGALFRKDVPIHIHFVFTYPSIVKIHSVMGSSPTPWMEQPRICPPETTSPCHASLLSPPADDKYFCEDDDDDGDVLVAHGVTKATPRALHSNVTRNDSFIFWSAKKVTYFHFSFSIHHTWKELLSSFDRTSRNVYLRRHYYYYR